MNKHRFISLILATTLIFGLFACSAQSEPTAPTTIRIAALPVLDTLPMYVAEQAGLFEQQNINLEVIPAGSAPKRDELINAGQADGMINEVMSTIFYNRDETRVGNDALFF